MKTRINTPILAALLSVALTTQLHAQTAAITYQGHLSDNSGPANGIYDLRFEMFDAPTNGAAISVLTNAATVVTDGLFTVTLDFGADVFDGSDRWLEISAVTNGGGAFTTLSPRQQITSSPYAIKAGNAMTVDMGIISNPNFIGTTTMTPLELFVNNQRALRLEDNGDGSSDGDSVPDGAPNMIGGSTSNSAAAGVVGATISGGGATNHAGSARPNTIASDYATIGGGSENAIWANAPFATVGGGQRNAAAATNATVAGGNSCWAGGIESFVGGGSFNQAAGDRATISGGNVNFASGTDSTVPGGRLCSAAGSVSFAAGNQAKANHTGAFVWADSQTSNFVSTANNQFLIRASGGVGIGLTRPLHSLHVGQTLGSNSVNAASQRTVVEDAVNNGRAAFLALAGAGGVSSERIEVQMEANEPGGLGLLGTASAHPLEIRTDNQARLSIASGGDLSVSPANTLAFGSQVRQMLNLWSTIYGIGVQSDVLYCRSDTGFAWFRDGVHSDTQNDPGAGGTLLMRLDGTGNLFTSGAVNPPSDRNMKKDFEEFDPVEVLQKVLTLPLRTWVYTNSDAVRHLGPVAQDFHAAFGLGADDKHIATVDADGVALAAIQGLNQKLEQKLEQKETEITELRQQLMDLKELVVAMNHKLNGGAK